VEGADRALELLVDVLSSANEAYRGDAQTVPAAKGDAVRAGGATKGGGAAVKGAEPTARPKAECVRRHGWRTGNATANGAVLSTRVNPEARGWRRRQPRRALALCPLLRDYSAICPIRRPGTLRSLVVLSAKAPLTIGGSGRLPR